MDYLKPQCSWPQVARRSGVEEAHPQLVLQKKTA